MNLLTRQSASEPSRSIELAEISLESDTSEHSFTLRDIVVQPGRSPSVDEMTVVTPFASPTAPGPSFLPKPGPAPTNAFTKYRERMMSKNAHLPVSNSPTASLPQRQPSDEVGPSRYRSLGMGRKRSVPLRVSIDLPKGSDAATIQDAQVQGRLVRKRRRLPLKWVLMFGIVSTLCLLVGLTTLSIGIYNLTKLRAGRAAKSVADLERELLPKLDAILAKLGIGPMP